MRRFLSSFLALLLIILICITNTYAASFSFSIDAAEQFRRAWNDYYITQNIDLYCGYSLKENSNEIQAFIITYNIDEKEKPFSTDIIPSDASVFISYDPFENIFGFCVFAKNMKNDLEKAVIYSDDKAINDAIVGSTHYDKDMWSIVLKGQDIYDLYAQDEITLKLTIAGKNEIIDITKTSNQYLYDMVIQLIAASCYSDKNNQGYLGTEYLPEGYIADNTITTESNTKYSFSEDYDAIENAVQSLFYVEIYDNKNTMLGNASGFVSFEEHLFVTNQHVIDGASYLKIWDEKDNMYVIDQVVASDKTYDVALLLFPNGMKYDSLAQSTDEIKRGQPIVAIGSPRGLQGTVSNGIISGFQKLPGYGDLQLIQISAAISEGSSGGALFNDSGRVIGITSAGMTEGQNLNFSVPISVAQNLYAEWDKKSTEKLGSQLSWNTARLKTIEAIFNSRARTGVYEGDLVNGVPNGQGTFQSDDGLLPLHYEGEWKDGKVHGKGVMTDEGYMIHFAPKNSKSYDRTGTFSGAVQNGIPTGKGRFKAKDNDGTTWIYSGEFSKGTFNGLGETVWEDDDSYTEVGNYTNGLFNPTWVQLIEDMAKRSDYTMYSGSKNFLKRYEKCFTDKIKIDSSLVNRKWKSASFFANPSKYCEKLTIQKNITVVHVDPSKYERDVTLLGLENKDGVAFFGVIDGTSKLKPGDIIKSMYLLPIDKVGNINAIFCAVAKYYTK